MIIDRNITKCLLEIFNEKLFKEGLITSEEKNRIANKIDKYR